MLTSFLRAAALWLLLSGSAFAACDGRDLRGELRADYPEIYAGAEAAAAAHLNAEGTFWRVSRGDAPPSYLFGTYHHVVDDTATGTVEELLPDARLLFVEFVHGDRKELEARLAANPKLFLREAPRPLADWLTEKETKTLLDRLAARKIPPAAAPALAPWFLNMLLSVPDCALAATAEGDFVSMDHKLERTAVAAGVETRGLETVEQQARSLKELAGDQAEAMVRMALSSQFLDADGERTFRQLYREQKIMMIWALEAAFREAHGSGYDVDVDAEAELEAIAFRRNRAMAEKLGPEMERGGVIVAVGALHLPGEDGLVNILRQRGFTVERVR